jgi:hypothetical protein
VKKKIEATYKAEINSTAEHPKAKYKENEFADTVKSHESSHSCVNSTIKIATTFVS